jgi:dTDP-4-dehydrorhamnose reductase
MTAHLVIGAGGQIGWALAAELRRTGADVITTTRDGVSGSLPLDLAAVDPHWEPPRSPDIVYLCAAMTSLAACESDPVRAHAVNVDGPIGISKKLSRAGAFCVFLSSNAVFDGRQPRPASADPTCPANTYGRLKAEAEASLSGIWDGRFAVLRLTKVFHAGLPLAARWTDDLIGARPVSAFDDMLFAPVSMDATIDAILKLAGAEASGIFHLSGECDVSYLAAARALAGALGAPESLVRPGSWREVPGLLTPPPATALGMGPRERILGLGPQPLNDVVRTLVPRAGAMAGSKMV